MNLTLAPAPPVAFDVAVDALYRAFEDVPFRPGMPRCGHCVSAGDVAALDRPARSLEPALVARFVTKAGTTWGSSEDLRRIAPRALHLAADQQLPVNRAVVLHQLAAASWGDWPAAQVDAVCRFLLAEWARVLASPARSGHAAHRWLRQTATAVADIEPFLAGWHDAMADGPGPPAVHLAVLLVNSELRPDFPNSAADLFDPPVTSAGAGASVGRLSVDAEVAAQLWRPAHEQLGSWLTATATELHLRRSAEALAHTTDARRLTLAVERLRRFHATRDRLV